jgi:hypothetical protein
VWAGVWGCQILFLEEELEIGQESRQRIDSHEIFLFSHYTEFIISGIFHPYLDFQALEVGF